MLVELSSSLVIGKRTLIGKRAILQKMSTGLKPCLYLLGPGLTWVVELVGTLHPRSMPAVISTPSSNNDLTR